MKTCPDCAERVQSAASKCRYCGHRFDPASGDTAVMASVLLAPLIAVVLIVGGILYILLHHASGTSSETAPTPKPEPELSAARKAARLASCRSSVALAGRTGLITGQRGGLTISVDEQPWAALAWTNKLILMDCLAIIRAGGGKPDENDIVVVNGAHSGKELAGGSPGAGTLAPR